MQVANQAVETIKNMFNFEVKKLPLVGPDNTKTPFFGLFRDDTFEVVHTSSVTDRYEPHQTAHVITLFEACQEVFGECDVNCYFAHGHHLIVSPSKDQRKAIFGTADNIFPRLSIQASYDGTAFSASMGWYRDLCKNLHIPRLVSGTCRKIRHSASLHDRMDSLVKEFETLEKSWDNVAIAAERMQSATIGLDDFLNRLYPVPTEESGAKVTRHKNRTEAIFRRVLDERNRSGRGELDRDFTVSVWEAFNAVQGFTQHTAPRRGSVTSNDRLLKSFSDPTVVAAEALAMSLVA